MPVSSPVRPLHLATVAIVALLLAVAIPIASAGQVRGGSYPRAAHVTDTQAGLADVVSGDGARFSWSFEYGETQDYGSRTEPVDDPGSDNDKVVATTVAGLAPATTYHARLTWQIGGGTEHGDDFTFMTEPAGSAVAPGDLAPGGDPEQTPSRGAKDKTYRGHGPKLGSSAVTRVASGLVRVRLPGWDHPALLAPGGRVPVGSVLDTRAGTLNLTTALADGTTQTATFRGGVFEVRQSPRLGGLTDILLRRSAPRTCAAHAPAAGASAAAVRRLPPRELGRLWSHDRGGRYRTHGANSVATVRGTTWLTVELCDATVTRVSAGVVSVFDRRLGRRVLVRAGHSYRAEKA